jgi:hypothetical protein
MVINMSYFTNYPTVNYRFGNESTAVAVQDIGAYIDLIDRVKDDISFYQEYNLRDGDRPDQVSNDLYGSPDYHWTFYLLNDDIKERGWPLTRSRISDKAKEEYPNIVLTTRANIAEQFLVGSNIEGQASGVTGKILRRRPDMGQIIVEKTPVDRVFTGTPTINSELEIELTTAETFVNTSEWVVEIVTALGNTVATNYSIVTTENNTKATISDLSFGMTYQITAKVLTDSNFINNESILTTENEVDKNIKIDTVVEEYNAKHHYENASGNYVDISPNAPFLQRVSHEIRWTGSAVTVLAALLDPTNLTKQAAAAVEIAADKFIIDKINISNLSSIFTNFSLDELGVQAILGNLIPGGTALQIAGVLQSQFINDDEYTIDDWQTNFLVGVLGFTTELQSVVSIQLGAIINSIVGSGGTAPTSIVYHTFTLVDNQLDLITATAPQYIGFEFRSDANVDLTTALGGVYAALPFNTITANDTENPKERNFVTYKNLGFTGSVISQSPFFANKTTGDDGVLDNNSSFVFIQNEYEDYIATNYDAIIPATITPVTFLERYGKENEEVRPIKVLRPEVITQFDKQFKRILSETSGEQVETVIGSGFGDTSYTSSISAPSTNGGSSSSGGGGGSSY